MPYLAYGWPRALAASCQAPSGEAVYIALGADYLVVVYAAAIQIWTGGQHRMKIGELVRNPSSLQEEGGHVRAYWCPGRKCLAVLVSAGPLCATRRNRQLRFVATALECTPDGAAACWPAAVVPLCHGDCDVRPPACISQTDNNHLLYYGLLSSKEALWRFPDGREVKKVRPEQAAWKRGRLQLATAALLPSA